MRLQTAHLLAVAALVGAGVSLSAMVLRPDAAPTVSASGAQLFVAKGCAACHVGPAGAPRSEFGTSSIGPSLAAASSWAGDRRDEMSAEEYLTESMVDPGAFISPAWRGGSGGPTTGMPGLRLSDDEVAALVDYLLADPSARSG